MRTQALRLTSGFGMGIKRFLRWVLKHDDIQDLPLVYRVNEPVGWLAAVMLP
jgi:asparaginyl-tRNA synthetase